MKKLLVVACLLVMVGVAYAEDKIIDEKGVTLISHKWVVPEGKKTKDGYLEVATKSGQVYKIYPCGLVEKLTWKEVAPNTEGNTQQYLRFSDVGAVFTTQP